MPARGSAIGASIGQSIWPTGTQGSGRGASAVTAGVYPSGHVAAPSTWAGTPVPHLLGLVAAEIVLLGVLRHGFRHHHGG